MMHAMNDPDVRDVAAKLFGVAPEAVTPELYRRAKRSLFFILYYGGASRESERPLYQMSFPRHPTYHPLYLKDMDAHHQPTPQQWERAACIDRGILYGGRE